MHVSWKPPLLEFLSGFWHPDWPWYMLIYTSDFTPILSQIEQGDSPASEQLLPMVYDELRKLASQKLASEKPGQTLQATALVHEAYPYNDVSIGLVVRPDEEMGLSP